MADFGNGPYAWLRRNEFENGVGSCIADMCNPIQLGKNLYISEILHEKLSAWVTNFEANSDKKSFPWKKWNHEGVALAKSLKNEVNEKYYVEYHTPCEDPSYDHLKKEGKHIISI